ncbi:hypothetical protein A0H81_08930 [Grifola frondosa]|uniref:Cytochrome P450 n=1 Tax=Grifola frondosa TaxID=5627 RepID=A0A1C7M386_GRIFR|nr:hypothetical protein A0H81_08930 [Grifola frondosa]
MSARRRRQTTYLSSLLNDPACDEPILVRDTLVTLLFGGRDNTQNSLALALHALLSSPMWIQRVRNEAVENARDGQELDYSDLSVSDPPDTAG